jgi:hypothetical protein
MAGEVEEDDASALPRAAIAAVVLFFVALVGAYLGIRHYRESREQARAERMKEAAALTAQAKARFEHGELGKAEALLVQAAGLYPDSDEIRVSLETVQASAAFRDKDYARFLSIAEEAARRRPDSAYALGTLASALATQYAATGDETHRTRALETLERARMRAAGSAEAKAQYDEYSARIRHRLDTREIIDRGEYDRRFRRPTPSQ